MNSIQCVIFDMDGVLVDSEEHICQAAIEMFGEQGLVVEPEDFLPFVGTGENRYLGGVAEKYGFPFDLERDKTRAYEIYGNIVEGRLTPLPGVHAFIQQCRKQGLKLALATSADKVKMDINLKEMGLPAESFDVCINGMDVENKKPAPDIFLLAARRLGIAPPACLVVEDAVTGVQAAKAAGMHCLALTTSFSREELGKADLIAAHLEEALKDFRLLTCPA